MIHDLTIGAIIAALYLIFFLIRQRKFPATGTIVDVFIDSTVISGIISVFWRLSNQHYLGKLSGEEHIYIAIGCAALSFVLLKRVSRSFWQGGNIEKVNLIPDKIDRPCCAWLSVHLPP